MLAAAVADLFLLAMGVALSPFPLVAAIAAAGADDPATGPSFAAGWVAGLGALAALLLLAAGEIDPTNLTPDAWVQIVVGAALLLAALAKWRKRARGGDATAPPRWMASLDGGGARAFGIGAALAGANPKNLALATAGAAVVHYHGLFGREAVAAALAFVALGSFSVLGIVLLAASGGRRVAGALEALKRFMLRHNNLILTLVFAVIGAKVLWNGLAALPFG